MEGTEATILDYKTLMLGMGLAKNLRLLRLLFEACNAIVPK